MKKINFIWIFISVLLLLDITSASLGTSSNNKLRLNLNSLSFEQNTSNIIRAFSNYLAFNSTTTNFYSRFGILNTRPLVPFLNLPLNGSFHRATPELNWSNSTDPEQFSTISYIMEVSDNMSFPYTNYSNSSIRETNNVTRDVNLTLPGDAPYFWRIKAFDEFENSTSFSEIRNFTLDTTLPLEFNLTSPDNDSSSSDVTPTLFWDETVEINFDKYVIEFSNETDFSLINFTFGTVASVSNNSFSGWNSTQILEYRTWYWRVTAFDQAGNSRTSNTFIYHPVQAEVEAVQEMKLIFQGGGGSKGGTKRLQSVALDIIQPSPLSLFANDTITTPLFITNKGESTLREINLNALTNATNLNLELTQQNIGILLPGQTITIDLIIRSTEETIGASQQEIIVEANVLDPSFKDSAKFFVNLIEFGFGDKQAVLDKIEILRNIIEGNPECLELQELLDQAVVSLEKGEHNKALSLIEAAINACRDLLASLGKELVIETDYKNYYIAIIEVIVALILFISIYRYYKKRRGKNLKLR
ncbi:MAG: hypothetical protein QGF74_00670 [Candidatus Nanoarchaeia archaeon]|jgi:hypothetical protein|nr:hypothetical protein [Candidatus Nanoarchaeia archaeon]|tara:strand:- start:912 stop:2501 length:1590 start_codon:yes stop_codon:yes gene_type:complete